MKNLLSKRIFTASAVAVILLFTFSACKKSKKDDVDPIKRVTISLTGAQEVPANSSTGIGTAQIAYDPTYKTINYQISWQLGSATATTVGMHFHGAENGSDITSSPVTIGITGFTSNYIGSLSGTTRPLTADEEHQLLEGKWYLNIHSSTIPGGELRGNIKF